jgi:hypothetical protein
MTAKEYLEKNVSRDALLGIYGRLNLQFDGAGDVKAAQIIEGMAAAQGKAIRLTGSTLGRYRSQVGAVERKSSRAQAPKEEEAAPPQGELLEAVPNDGAERAGWAMVEKQQRTNELLEEIRTLLAGMLGRAVARPVGGLDARNLDALGADAVRLHGPRKIEGLKWIKAHSALGLKEAKELYERFAQIGPLGLVEAGGDR